jgi:hypothetical protein
MQTATRQEEPVSFRLSPRFQIIQRTFMASNGSVPTAPIIQQFHSLSIHTLLSVSKRGI